MCVGVMVYISITFFMALQIGNCLKNMGVGYGCVRYITT